MESASERVDSQSALHAEESREHLGELGVDASEESSFRRMEQGLPPLLEQLALHVHPDVVRLVFHLAQGLEDWGEVLVEVRQLRLYVLRDAANVEVESVGLQLALVCGGFIQLLHCGRVRLLLRQHLAQEFHDGRFEHLEGIHVTVLDGLLGHVGFGERVHDRPSHNLGVVCKYLASVALLGQTAFAVHNVLVGEAHKLLDREEMIVLVEVANGGNKLLDGLCQLELAAATQVREALPGEQLSGNETIDRFWQPLPGLVQLDLHFDREDILEVVNLHGHAFVESLESVFLV